MPDLYILFEKSNSAIGRIGRLLMPYPYTHVTISFDGKIYHSFSRRRLHDPFDAGLTEEKLSYFAYEEVEVKIYKTHISEEDRQHILAFMEEIRDCPFDIPDMVTMPILNGHKRDNAYNCMSFVSEALSIIGIPLLHPLYKNSIEDIEKALTNAGIEGQIVRLPKQIDEEYMAKVTLKEKLHSFVSIINRLYGKGKKDPE